MASQLDNLTDELMDLRVQVSIESDRARPDDEKLAELISKMRNIEQQIAQARRPMS